MNMDVDKAIRTAVDGGKVEFGTRSGKRSVANAKIMIFSSNCPPETKKEMEAACAKANVPVHTYTGTSIELGSVCGKAFTVSVLTVLEAGTSNILELAAKK
jgi:large subunit ribosomal protein L30e